MILTPPPTGGQQILRHALARRWSSIVAGTVAGLVVGVGTVFAVPVSHSATVSMTVTSPALTPAPAVRASLSNTTDMVTEQGIAKSAAVLDVAAARLGNGVTADDLRSNMEVSGDTNGTIVKIEYVAPTRQEAIDAADAIANAYLKERTALVEQRADEIASGINAQIEALESELASLAPQYDEDGNAKANPRAAEIRTAYQAHEGRRAARSLSRHRRPRDHLGRRLERRDHALEGSPGAHHDGRRHLRWTGSGAHPRDPLAFSRLAHAAGRSDGASRVECRGGCARTVAGAHAYARHGDRPRPLG